MSRPPIPCAWTGRAFEPLPRAHNLAAAHYGEGEVVIMEPVDERSEVSHKHEFAWLREAWKNLPENLADQFPTVEHLRKRALIEGKFYHETAVDAGSNAAALRVAAYMRAKDEFSVVFVRGSFAIERVAKSQRRAAMGREEFQASKAAILEIVAAMIGVDPVTLSRQEEAA